MMKNNNIDNTKTTNKENLQHKNKCCIWKKIVIIIFILILLSLIFGIMKVNITFDTKYLYM